MCKPLERLSEVLELSLADSSARLAWLSLGASTRRPLERLFGSA